MHSTEKKKKISLEGFLCHLCTFHARGLMILRQHAMDSSAQYYKNGER